MVLPMNVGCTIYSVYDIQTHCKENKHYNKATNSIKEKTCVIYGKHIEEKMVAKLNTQKKTLKEIEAEKCKDQRPNSSYCHCFP